MTLPFPRVVRPSGQASSKDPLGAAAPQIDVAALKAMSEETVSSELPELGEIVFPSLPGAGGECQVSQS